LRQALRSCDAAFHVAAVYEVGIPASGRPPMYAANVTGTENVLDAAVEAGVACIVYVSTVNAFGDTHGVVVDESYERPLGTYMSYYDQTKHLAHVAAEERIARGAPIVIVQPGVIYGPGDHSEIGAQIARAAHGRVRYIAFPTLGMNAAHVDDIAEGILLAHDKGRPGEAYVLGGEITRMKDLLAAAARAAGRKPPRLVLPTAALRALAPFGPLVGRLAGIPPNLRELISASDDVTYWASDAKARRELGYSSRSLSDGLRLTV